MADLRKLADAFSTLASGSTQFAKTYQEGQKENALKQFSKDITAKYPNDPELQSAIAAGDTSAVRQILANKNTEAKIARVDDKTQAAIESSAGKAPGTFKNLFGQPTDTAIKIAQLGQKQDSVQAKEAGAGLKSAGAERTALRKDLQKIQLESEDKLNQFKNVRDLAAQNTSQGDAAMIQLFARSVEENKGRMNQQIVEDLKTSTGFKDLQGAINYITGNPESTQTPQVKAAVLKALGSAENNYKQSLASKFGSVAASHINSGDNFIKNGSLDSKTANLLKLYNLEHEVDPNKGFVVKTPEQNTTIDFSGIKDTSVRDRAQSLAAGKPAAVQQQILNNALKLKMGQ